MKKRNDFDEFLRQLEKALEKTLNEMDIPENRPVDVNVSVNIYPVMVLNSEMPYVRKKVRTPVDIIETEKNIHAVVGLPGMEKENIKLSCDGYVLEITASNAQEDLNERIELPAKVNKKGIKVIYEKGILEVVLNKSRRKDYSQVLK